MANKDRRNIDRDLTVSRESKTDKKSYETDSRIMQNYFFQAAILDKLDLFQEAIQKGHNINAQDKRTGKSPLHLAAQFGSVLFATEAARVPGVEARVYDNTGKTPFLYALERADDEMMQLLSDLMFQR